MKYIMNACKSINDGRDWHYEGLSLKNIKKASSFDQLDYRHQLLSVRNQGDQGTCYCMSAACMKEWQELNDYQLKEYLSPQYIYNHRDYWNNNIIDGNDKFEDYGMTGRDVMKILLKKGVCKESEYQYGLIQKSNEIPNSIIDSARENKIFSYARINNLDGLKEALINNGPCLIAFPTYNYSDQMWIKNEGDNEIGGHAMTVVGYTNNSFIIRNSWGNDWGDNGYCYYKFSDWGKHWEIWTTIDINSFPNNDDNNNNNDIDKDSHEDININDIIITDDNDKIKNKKCIDRFLNYIGC